MTALEALAILEEMSLAERYERSKSSDPQKVKSLEEYEAAHSLLRLLAAVNDELVKGGLK